MGATDRYRALPSTQRGLDDRVDLRSRLAPRDRWDSSLVHRSCDADFGLFVLVLRRLSRSIISGPMFFTAAGFLLVATGLLESPSDDIAEPIKVVLELTLALVLFSDAMTTNVKSWSDEGELPTRLLLIAMPLVVLSGTVVALPILADLDLIGAALVATMLAPTDAVLGEPVVSNRRVPARIREALNIESGLNDGLAFPLLLFFIAIAEAEEGANIFSLLLSSLGVAVIVGVVAAWGFARLLTLCSEQGWMSPIGRQIGAVALPVVVFVLTEELGGSGFIATFVGGLVFGRLVLESYPDLGAFLEDLAEVGTMIAFLFFGGVILEFFLGESTWAMLVYAVLSLTVIRLLPVAVSMIGTHLRPPTLLYIGWFGPRGLASLVFAALLILDSDVSETDPIISVVVLTVAMSLVLHGVSAFFGANAYANWYERQHDDDEMIEGQDVHHVHERRRMNRNR
jgi:NhaP-type Na+/H+ or K+/H+ antiporter